MATCYHCMVRKCVWYRLPERLPQHQTRKLDICLIPFLVITVSKSTEYTEQVQDLARSWSAPACNTSSNSFKVFNSGFNFIPSNGEYPQTSIFLELPWPTWQKWKCIIKICDHFMTSTWFNIFHLIESSSILSLLQKSPFPHLVQLTKA